MAARILLFSAIALALPQGQQVGSSNTPNEATRARGMIVTVTPDGGSANVPSNIDTDVQFIVDSQGLTGPVNYGISIQQCFGSGLAGTCTAAPSSVTLDQNVTTAIVKIRFRSAGSGTVTIQIRATSQLPDTDEGSLTATVVTPAVSVTANAPNVTVPPLSSQTATFTVSNPSIVPDTVNVSAACPNSQVFKTCFVPGNANIPLDPGGSQPVIVTYETNQPSQTGQLTLTASINGQSPPITASASTTVTTTAGTAAVAVTPDNGTSSANTNTSTSVAFSVQNTGTAVLNLTFAASCTPTGFATCGAITPSSLTINPDVPFPAPQNVTVNFTTGNGNPASGQVTLTATATGTNPLVQDNGSYTVTLNVQRIVDVIAPNPSSVTLAPGAPSSTTFTVNNPTVVPDTVLLSTTCAGVPSAIASCPTPSPSQIIVGAQSSSPVTLNFNAGATPNASGTITLKGELTTNPAINDNAVFTVTVQQVSGSVAVTPDNAAITRAVNTTVSDTFRVANTGGAPATFTLSSSCTGVTFAQCTISRSSIMLGQGASDTVSVTHRATATGSGTISVTASGAGSDNGSYAVTVAAPVMATVIGGLRTGIQQVGRCAASCFTARHALTTVPYFSLGQARSITLAYDGDQLAVRPIVTIDAQLGASAPALSEYRLSVRDSAGAAITLVNGESVLRFAPPPLGSTQPFRLAAQFDAAARNWNTGEHNVSVIVTARFPGGYVEYDTITVPVLVLNERKSPVGRGWTVAGLQRVYTVGTGRLITEGDGSVYRFSNCAPTCTSPTGDVSRLTTTGFGAIREYPDSSRVEFNTQGRMTLHITRTQDTTVFGYDGQGRLTGVYDPFRTASGGNPHLFTLLTYGANGLLQTITEPGPNQQQAGGRVTTLGTAADSTLQSWTDPDGVSTQLRYDAQKRLQHLINRRGDTTTIHYNTTTWKLDSIQSPSIAVDPRLYGANQTRRLTTSFRPWQTLAVPTSATSGTAWLVVRADTARGVVTAPGSLVSAFTVDGWGQAVETTVNPLTSLQQITTLFKSPLTPYPDSVRYHTGAVDLFRFNQNNGLLEMQRLAGQDSVRITYQAFAQPQQISGPRRPTITYTIGQRGRIESENYASGFITQYAYDARHRVLRVTDPGLHVDTLSYDAIFGQLSRVARPGNRVTTTLYDGFGRDTVTTMVALAPQGKEYDLLNRVTETRNNAVFGFAPDSVRYAYDNLFPTTVTSHVSDN